MQHLGESLWCGNPASKWIALRWKSGIDMNPPLPSYGNLPSIARPRLNQFRMNPAPNYELQLTDWLTDSKEVWRPHSNHNKNLIPPRCDLKSVSALGYLTWHELKTYVQWERMKIQIDFDSHYQLFNLPFTLLNHSITFVLTQSPVKWCHTVSILWLRTSFSVGCGSCWRFRETPWEAYSRYRWCTS